MKSLSNLQTREFECTRCDYFFKERVGEYEAPPCHKCRDFEYIKRADLPPPAIPLEFIYDTRTD